MKMEQQFELTALQAAVTVGNEALVELLLKIINNLCVNPNFEITPQRQGPRPPNSAQF